MLLLITFIIALKHIITIIPTRRVLIIGEDMEDTGKNSLEQIYYVVNKASDILNHAFGIKSIHQRMVYMASVLAAKRNGLLVLENKEIRSMEQCVLNTISSLPEDSLGNSGNICQLMEVYEGISVNPNISVDDIDLFCNLIDAISDYIDSDKYRGEDIIGMVFNSAVRYGNNPGKGELYTPGHIVSLLCNLLNVAPNDRVLDAACGSNAFIIHSLYGMRNIVNTVSQGTKKGGLFAIEYDRYTFALACANMLIYGQNYDGIDLACLDSRTSDACDWIRAKRINKVLMNPPYETKYGSLEIVENVLRNVSLGATCAFILPDKKLEKDKRGKRILNHSTLEAIIKLPENLFYHDIKTSIFLFSAGVSHGEGKKIFTCYLKKRWF